MRRDDRQEAFFLWLLICACCIPRALGWLPRARREACVILCSRTIRLDATSSSCHEDHEDLPSEQATKLPEDGMRRMVLSSPAVAASAALLLGFPRSSSALDDVENKRIAIFEKASPSVVFIDTFTERRDAFSTNILEVPLGSGSGFVWDNDGHIVTNYHVIRNAQTAQIAILTTDVSNSNKNTMQAPVLSNQGINAYTSMRPTSSLIKGASRSVFKAQVVGVDPGKDIAVLKVDAPKALLSPLKAGSSANLKVGQSVMAIGNPFGLDHSLTSGIISGLGREVKSPIGRPITNVVQIDAAINP